MKNYNVRLYFHTFVDIEVAAEDEQTAIEIAENESDKLSANKFTENMVQSETDTDVTELE